MLRVGAPSPGPGSQIFKANAPHCSQPGAGDGVILEGAQGLAPSLRFAYVVEVTNRLLFPERYSRRAWLPSPQHATPILQAPAASALPFFLQLEVPSFPVSLPCLPPERAAVGRLVPRGSLLMGPCVPEMVLPTTSLHSPATSGGEMAHAGIQTHSAGSEPQKNGFHDHFNYSIYTPFFIQREKRKIYPIFLSLESSISNRH